MTAAMIAASAAVGLLVWVAFLRYSRRNDDMFTHSRVVVAGGSEGLGRAIAELMVKEGAKEVSVWARREAAIAEAVADLKAVVRDCGVKTAVSGRSVDVTDYEQVKRALSEPEECADVVFCCAGASNPGWFLQQPLQEMYDGMQLNYFGALHVARAAATRMVATQTAGRIVFISSTVGLMGMIGYSQYAPSKWALRGLAECLNQEFLKHRITFHVYFVASIRTPGFEREEARKPAITKVLEGGDVSGDQSAMARAACLVDGLKGNRVFVASDFFTRLLLATSEGFNLRLREVPVAVLGWLVLPLVRIYFKVTIMRAPHFNQQFVH